MTGATGGRPVYLDYNATAPVRPEVVAAMADAMAAPGNATSVHAFGRDARRRVERARTAIAARLDLPSSGIVFTSGGTEANHLGILGFPGPRLVSAIEHASVLDADPAAPRIPVDATGRIDLAELERLLAEIRPTLVSLMLANNETGIIQPVAEAARLTRAVGALLHVDAVQAFGKVPFTLASLGADLISLSAHKIGGPPGIGALALREGVEPAPLLRGGGQETRRRAGTENLPGILGWAVALEQPTDWERVAALRDRLDAAMAAIEPGLQIAGAGVPRLPNTSCLLSRRMRAETRLMALDLAGVAVSSGAACSSGRVAPSHVLSAMGVEPVLAQGAIRVSLGWASTSEDVARLLSAWGAIGMATSFDTGSPGNYSTGI